MSAKKKSKTQKRSPATGKPPKLLVANRGEIACRIFQTCREMGIGTIAIYTAPDAQARHVTYADEVFEVGSYLDPDQIVECARRAGATLIHPGYGFLSERATFVEKVEKAGLIFVGPRADSMRAMGDKIASKKLAEKSRVPTLPWAILDEETLKDKTLVAMARKMGFPVLLKAAAGGGGKGMRRVDREKDLLAAAESASREALAAFGDGALFMEKYLAGPRHIEVQVFGDGKGGGVHLGERECSLQRRHQKVWEEAPACLLADKTRQALHSAALKLVRATRYRSAGTCEFLVDGMKIYFLEMNTRLQVEHPVTELAYGVDLVRWQIELALGKNAALKNKLNQKTLSPRGHAIEVRLYAENPAQSYAPTPGTITHLRWPNGVGIRVDSGIEAQQEVTTHFDPMLAKLVVWAPDREQAVARIRYALDETQLAGIGSNLDFLRRLSEDSVVVAGKMDITYLDKAYAPYDDQPDDLDLALLRASADIATKSQLGSTVGADQKGNGAKSSRISPWEVSGSSLEGPL